MANQYNQKPISIDTVQTQGWRASQTLNPGTIVLNGITYSVQPGLFVFKVVWEAPSAIGHTFSIIDPIASNVLLSGTCGVANQDVEYDFSNVAANWRDFEVSQILSGKLLIWYR